MVHDFHYGFYHKSPYQIVIYSKDLDPQRFELDIHGCNHADQMSQNHANVQGQPAALRRACSTRAGRGTTPPELGAHAAHVPCVHYAAAIVHVRVLCCDDANSESKLTILDSA